MNRLRLKAEAGFTLIELLVVIAIIGILAAIAIPQFAAYRRRGYDANIKADLRNAATSQEAYFTDNDQYTGSVASLKTGGYNQSSNITMSTAASTTTYVITGSATKGCGASTGIFNISSTTGSIAGTACGP